jgi:lysozyme
LRNIMVSLTQGQFDALVSFTYNLGDAALQRSTLRQKINRYEHEEVPKELKRLVYVRGRVLLGLIKRREAEAEMYLS